MQVAIILKSPNFCDNVVEENVIFADGAYKFKDKIGKKNIVAVVGDFDSLGAAPKKERVISLSVEKNFTDGERAVHLAKEKGFNQVTIYGAFGGKIEHVLGNIALLKIASSIGLNARIKEGANTMRLISGKTCLSVKKDCNLSLIPYGEKCVFIDSKGLYYPLKNLTLTSCDTRGISNKTVDDKVSLEIIEGESLIIYQEN